MSGIDRRRVMLGSALIGAAGLAVAARPPRPHTRLSQDALDRAVPITVPGYRTIDTSGVVLPPQDALSQLIYDGLVIRSYLAPDGMPLSLVVAYGATQDYALQLHRPEICYPASGFRVGAVDAVPLSLEGHPIAASTLLATRGSRQERLLYWTRLGDRFPVTLWQERAAIVAAALRHEAADGVLVRLSTSAEGGASALLDFAHAWAAALPPVGRTLLLGARSA
jgi:EpsI family protein